ncbi:hypothetical protein CWC33_05975 [Idiomarina sp. X4]|uniref:hypothetical protein n=1 Tax=Idiomarina sp. X4 TaxID=2055892 RepID=UPI000C289478|nr:hypothetical protein [Idiomarina sp. X4]ATZ73271.1 hypothetical protein CWC33_05975 [Idiomarina sp. X4]
MKSEVQNAAIREFTEFKRFLDIDTALTQSVWQSKLSTGKTLEFISLLGVMRELMDGNLDLCTSEYLSRAPELMYLRNEIPHQHSAQAGHDASVSSDISLKDRFHAALLPKAEFTLNNNNFMVFREGNPLHLIDAVTSGRPMYKERPDLVIVEGKITINSDNSSVQIIHRDNKGELLQADLSVKNTNLIPLKSFSKTENYMVTTRAIFECSVSKSQSHVDTQLSHYISIFETDSFCPFSLFIHGGKKTSLTRSTVLIDMKNIVNSFSSHEVRSGLRKFIKSAIL